jgi:hypothetical protein
VQKMIDLCDLGGSLGLVLKSLSLLSLSSLSFLSLWESDNIAYVL